MSKAESKEPVYDDRVNRILDYLKQGLTRDEVAEKFQYSSYRSMEIFMNRKNFKWDKRAGTYIPVQSQEESSEAEEHVPSDKVRRILRELEKDGANLKGVAKKMEFESHLQMAAYMKSKGYEWSEEKSNYVRAGKTVRQSKKKSIS